MNNDFKRALVRNLKKNDRLLMRGKILTVTEIISFGSVVELQLTDNKGFSRWVLKKGLDWFNRLVV